MPNGINNQFKFIREFQEWEWMEKTQGLNAFDPAFTGAGNYDTHYASMKACGVKVVPVIQSSPKWFSSTTSWDNQWKPMSSTTLNAELPSSYYAASRFAWQFGARYGRVKYPASSLTIDTVPFYTFAKPNEKLSGLDLLEFVEYWNEGEKTWKGRNGRFTAFEMAAYISAVVDGHCGTMGPNLGLKTADPSMKFVMAGMYDLHFEFLKSMVLWFKNYRPDRRVPIDVVNVHHYSNSLGGQFIAGAVGISPEADQLVTSITQFVTQCKTILPDIPVWVSEFGYDSSNGSLQKVPSITGQTLFLTQANFILRSILAFTKAKVDKSFIFNIYDEDVNQNTAGTYQSSGLVIQESLGYEPKPGYNYILAFRDLMSNFYYLKDNSISGTYVYKYSDDFGNYVYACWSPTSNNTEYTFNLTLEETNVIAIQYKLIETQSTFESRKLQIINNSVNITVNETPKFIFIRNQSALNSLYPIKIKNKKFF